MPGASIREATEADLAAILQIYRDAGLETEGFTLAEAQTQFRRLQQHPSYRVFVAETGDSVAGVYSLIILDGLAKRGMPAGVVESVGVLPSHQGSGVGRTMMEHAREQCRAAGCYKMTLSSNLKREGAHAFYDALGFERHGYSFLIRP